jgi:hypothetical protein
MKEKETAEKDLLDGVPRGKKIVCTSIIWFLIIVTFTALGFLDTLLPIFYVGLLLSCGFALYFRKGFTFYVFPTSLRVWIMNARLVVACRGPEGAWTSDGLKGLSLLQQIPSALLGSSILPLIGMMAFASSIYTPILDLDQMNRDTGIVERATYTTGRRASGTVLKMRTIEGKLLIFRNIGSREDIKYLKALNKSEPITVWWQPEWNVGFTNVWSRRMHQLKHGDYYLQKYDKGRLLRHVPVTKNIFYICLGYIVFSITICWVVGNKYLKERG